MNPTYSKQPESFLDKQSEKQVARIKKAIMPFLLEILKS